MRRHGADGIAGTGEIDVDLIVPVGILPFQDRFERLNAGIGKENVEPAKAGTCLRGSRPQCRKIALVERGFAPASARRFDQAAGFGKFVARRRRNLKRRADRPGNIDAHDIGALAGESDGDRATDPTRSAGDDGGFAGKPASGSLLHLWFCLSHDAFLRW